ncbi:MAG: MaoC family dehydratase [Tissierellia bacterium]|nr:MaoC family dehydratase [Tissierellia bacterium]
MSEAVSVAYDDIKIGDTAEISKVVTDEDIRKFAEVSLDENPIHLNEEFAKNSMFKQRIAHGMLSAGLISAVIGTKLPGVNTIYMGQDLKFVAPVFIGDEVTAVVEVVDKRDDKHIVTLKTTVKNQDGKEVITGQAVVLKK